MRLLLAIVALFAASAAAEPPKSTQPVSGSVETFLTLPPDYQKLIGQGMDRFLARDFVGALLSADQADALHAPTVWTINIRGAVAIEKRQFAEGTKYCQAALALDPQFFPAMFNLCEIPFLQGQYSEASEGWQKLLTNYPRKNDSIARDGTPELLTYRIYLCYLLDKDFKSAGVWLDKLPFPSDTAAYYYAHAAWEKVQGHEDKWKDWCQQAEFIWPAAKRANFIDVLIQLGWIRADGTRASAPGQKLELFGPK